MGRSREASFNDSLAFKVSKNQIPKAFTATKRKKERRSSSTRRVKRPPGEQRQRQHGQQQRGPEQSRELRDDGRADNRYTVRAVRVVEVEVRELLVHEYCNRSHLIVDEDSELPTE